MHKKFNHVILRRMENGYFSSIVDKVMVKSPFQRKKINQYLASRDSSFFSEAEEFAKTYTGYLESIQLSVDAGVEAYLGMCKDMLRCQIDFLKTGRYPTQDASQSTGLYNDHQRMTSYMIGLAISQFLWKSHYEEYRCLLETLSSNKNRIKTYLEVGPGHGLFLNKAIECLQPDTKFTAIDISPVSIEITKSIMRYLKPEVSGVQYIVDDFLKASLNTTYDFITMGEVLEHVDFPQKFLKRLGELLNPEGRAFVSTCVNCPAVDHVYQFESVDAIRQMFAEHSFQIEKELVLPVEDLPMDEVIRRKITINYCAILKKTDL